MTGTVFTEFQKSAESQRRREKVKAIDLNSIERRISTELAQQAAPLHLYATGTTTYIYPLPHPSMHPTGRGSKTGAVSKQHDVEMNKM